MTNENIFLRMNIGDLAAQPEAMYIGDRFVLVDNLDKPLDEMNNDNIMFESCPIKLSFTIVIVVVKGGIKVKINLEDYDVLEGNAITVLNGNIGEFCSMLPNTRLAVIAFSDNFFNAVEHINTAMSIHQYIYKNPLLHMKSDYMSESLDIYNKMKSKLSEVDNDFREGALRGYTQILMYNAFNYFEKEKKIVECSSEFSRSQEILSSFKSAVQKDYKKERSVAYYADLLCITPKYLSQVIKNLTGRLAGDWISDYVILEAKALLKSKKYTAQQVGDMLNFPSQSFFGKYFKRKTGMSPRSYMKN